MGEWRKKTDEKIPLVTEWKRDKNIEGYISDRSRKRVYDKLLVKIERENEKEKDLKE